MTRQLHAHALKGTQSMQFFTCEPTFNLLSRRRFEMSLWGVCWYGNYYQCSTLCRSLDKTSHFPESKEILIWMLLWHNEKEEISLNWAMRLLIILTNISFMSWHDTFRGCGACWAGGRYLASSQSKRESVKYQTNGYNHFLYQVVKGPKKVTTNTKEPTTGSPRPTRAHGAVANICLNWSATGEIWFSGGNTVDCRRKVTVYSNKIAPMVHWEKSQRKLCKLNSLWVLKQLCCLGKCKVMQPFLFLVSGDFILFIWLRVNAAFWYETAYHWDSLRVASCKFTFT